MKIFQQGDRRKSQQKKDNSSNNSHQSYHIDILLVFAIVNLSISLYFCWGIVINPESDADNVKFAFALITSIVSGLVGFVTGKAINWNCQRMAIAF